MAVKHFVQMASFDAKLLFILHFICSTLSAPQHPEINDQFTTSTAGDETKQRTDETLLAADEAPSKVINPIQPKTTTKADTRDKENQVKPEESRKYFVTNMDNRISELDPKPNLLDTIYEILTRPISKFLASPKVSFVLRNVGTCVVNGVMEIISHYFPAPFIPLIASAAGMVIPFEPVVMLKEKMPVTSYRRAFRKAMNSFLNTFDAYKLDSLDDDPYMTRRFNRRFMNDVSGEKEKKT